jgi:hypothetical protein
MAATEVQIPVYNITAPGVVVVPPTRSKFVGYIMSGGSAGNLTFNDCATLAAASSANQILSLPYNVAAIATIGVSNALNWPLLAGLVVSSVPTGATLAVIYTQFVGA